MRRVLIGTALAFGVLASPALAADQVVTGLDAGLKWDKETVPVMVGEKVTWTFAGTAQAHHVAADGVDAPDPRWTSLNSPIGVPAPDASFVFQTPGAYRFICTVHPDSMRGTVLVGDVPAPPPVEVPASQQLLANDAPATTTFEKVEEDKAKPKLSKVSAKRVAKGSVRVRFRVNEESTVLISLKRGGKTVKKVELAGSGTGAVTIKKAKAGRYSVQVRATDIAGNVSSLKKTSITVR